MYAVCCLCIFNISFSLLMNPLCYYMEWLLPKEVTFPFTVYSDYGSSYEMSFFKQKSLLSFILIYKTRRNRNVEYINPSLFFHLKKTNLIESLID